MAASLVAWDPWAGLRPPLFFLLRSRITHSSSSFSVRSLLVQAVFSPYFGPAIVYSRGAHGGCCSRMRLPFGCRITFYFFASGRILILRPLLALVARQAGTRSLCRFVCLFGALSSPLAPTGCVALLCLLLVGTVFSWLVKRYSFFPARARPLSASASADSPRQHTLFHWLFFMASPCLADKRSSLFLGFSTPRPKGPSPVPLQDPKTLRFQPSPGPAV